MFCYNNNNWSTPEKNIENLQHTIKGIKSTDKNFYIKIYGLMLTAEIYWDKLKDYEQFFETYDEILYFIKNIKESDYPGILDLYRRLGNGYYFFGDYDNAIKYFRIATDFPETEINSYYLRHSYNGLGLSYQQMNKLDSSDYYFIKMFNLKYSEDKERYKGIASGNMGYNEYLRKNYDSAAALFKKILK